MSDNKSGTHSKLPPLQLSVDSPTVMKWQICSGQFQHGFLGKCGGFERCICNTNLFHIALAGYIKEDMPLG